MLDQRYYKCCSNTKHDLTVKSGDEEEESLGDTMETDSLENEFYSNETKQDSLKAKNENLTTLEQLDTNLETFSKCI